jgi:hypothetical protein
MKLISTQKYLHYIQLYGMAMSICVNQIQHKSILTDIEFCQNSRQETYTQTHRLVEVHCSAQFLVDLSTRQNSLVPQR